ncbi:MAG TPA: hypothetical protein DCY61_04345 [Dehalococcoidia bacterium]|nr:hypothetical protein [Dehalococcoidia bacterium]
MDNTVGAAAQRRGRRRKQLVIGLLVLLVIGGLASSLIGPVLTQGKGPTTIASGTGAELETVFVGPPELEVVWESVIGQTWSVSLVQGRIRNISNTTVRFKGITYSVKDESGDVIWEETDPRYIMGGVIEPLASIFFVSHPISGREARTFELLVKDAQVLKR